MTEASHQVNALASREALAHPEYKDAVVRGRAEEAVLTTLYGAEWPNAKHRVA